MPKYKVSASTVPGHTALRVCLLSVPEHECLVTGRKWCCVHTSEYPISNCVPYLAPFALSYSILKLELNMEYKAADCPSNVRTMIRCPLSCPGAKSPNLNRPFYSCGLGTLELNNNTAHRTHNNTVSWFIPLQSDSQTLTKLDEKTSKENSRSQCFYNSSRSRLLSTHVLITFFGSPSPNLVVLLNVTKL